MKTARLVLVTLFALAPFGAVQAQSEGLLARADTVPWPRWQARLSLGNLDSYRYRSGNLSLMSDYFFARSASSDGSASGFRATGGLLVGQRPSLWMVSPGMSGSSLIGADRRLPGDAAEGSTLSYLGVGYSGLSGRNGWNFSADFGLVGVPAGNVIRLGRAFNGTPAVDDLVRDLRLSPTLQVGVSYSF